MKISDSEKLMLLMLSEIYEKLEVKGKFDPKFIKSAIFDNHTWGIPWEYDSIPFEDKETPKIVFEVLDILQMWGDIERDYNALSEKEKASVEKKAPHFGKDPKFIGFDGNHEPKYWNTALFIVKKLNRFVEFKGRDLNSHCPLVDSYKRMLPVYNSSIEKKNNQPLSAPSIANILRELIHPENRDNANNPSP